MARSRRRRTSVRRPRPKMDWVYRPNIRTQTPLTGVDNLGTYEPTVRSIGTGTAEANAVVLYDSHNRMSNVMRGTTGAIGMLNNAARAEAQRPLVTRVEGGIYLEPSTWAVGNLMAAGLRIIVCEQDFATGLALLDSDYSMWNNSVDNQPASWANNYRLNMREKRFFQGFDTNDSLWYVRFGWRGRIRLEPNEALFLWIELEGTSVNGRYQTWFRSLVSDES